MRNFNMLNVATEFFFKSYDEDDEVPQINQKKNALKSPIEEAFLHEFLQSMYSITLNFSNHLC